MGAEGDSISRGFNLIGDEGAGRLAEVLGQCSALAVLDLGHNGIGAEGAGRLAGGLGQYWGGVYYEWGW